MSHGLEVWDANGSIVLSVTSKTGRFLYKYSVAEAAASGSVPLPAGLDQHSLLAVPVLDIDGDGVINGNYINVAHGAEIISSTLYWYSGIYSSDGSPPWPRYGPTDILVFSHG